MAADALKLPHGTVTLPAFFPDATYGAVRCVDADDLERCGVQGLVMNSMHLASKPGMSVLRGAGGIHAFTGWNRPIITDSGGFQVFSLIRENPRYGEVRRNEVIFRPETGREKVVLTPEKSVQAQFALGSDVIMCLDHCTHPSDSFEANEVAVAATVDWARRCKAEYARQLEARRPGSGKRPLIFGIVQGGNWPELRKRCAHALEEIGFDGYGFGGWPIDASGGLVEDILRLTAELMPGDKPKYAMGIGQPDGMRLCYEAGYVMFDCVAPTREARHHRLYVFDGGGAPLAWKHYYILDDMHMKEDAPVSSACDCLLCRRYSRAYLHHLCKAGDSLALRLATIHNIRFYMQYMERLRAHAGAQ